MTTLVPIHDACGLEEDLEQRVRIFLDGRNVPGLRRLGVAAVADKVTLYGRVRTFYEKQLALNCCQRVAGVIEVVDAIEVGGDAD